MKLKKFKKLKVGDNVVIKEDIIDPIYRRLAFSKGDVVVVDQFPPIFSSIDPEPVMVKKGEELHIVNRKQIRGI